MKSVHDAVRQLALSAAKIAHVQQFLLLATIFVQRLCLLSTNECQRIEFIAVVIVVVVVAAVVGVTTVQLVWV